MKRGSLRALVAFPTRQGRFSFERSANKHPNLSLGTRSCFSLVNAPLTEEDFYVSPEERQDILRVPKLHDKRTTKLKIRVHTPSPQPLAPLLSTTPLPPRTITSQKVSPLGRFNLQLSNAWLKKDVDAMISLYREMRDCGIKPNLTTIHHLLRAYDFAGMVENAFNTILDLGSLNIQPTTYTFNIVLSVSCSFVFLKTLFNRLKSQTI